MCHALGETRRQGRALSRGQLGLLQPFWLLTGHSLTLSTGFTERPCLGRLGYLLIVVLLAGVVAGSEVG